MNMTTENTPRIFNAQNSVSCPAEVPNHSVIACIIA